MKQLSEILHLKSLSEALKIGSKSKVNTKIKVKTKGDLKLEILKKIMNKETDYNDIDVSGLDDLSYAFEDQDISEIDISEWDVSNVESTKCMFQGCRYLKTTGDLSKWNISNMKIMSFMFNGCQCLTNIGDLSKWDVNDISMKCMFQGCKRLKDIGDIYNWKPKEPNWDIFQYCDLKYKPRKRI